jgi:hypothetical protein
MKLKTLLVASAVLAVIFGIASLVIPGMFMSFLGVMGSVIPMQVLGANFIGFAILNYFARNVKDEEALRSIVLANLVSDALGLVLGLYAQLTSGGMWFGWLSVVIYLLLVLGFGYFLVTGPRRSLASMSR